jgi:hypothetical protein
MIARSSDHKALTAAGSICFRSRWEPGEDVDLLAVTPNAQREPRSGRLSGNDFHQVPGLSNLQAGGPHDLIAGFQASRLRYAVVDHPVDARHTIALVERDAELRE